MTQHEKLDIILKSLYVNKDDSRYFSISGILQENQIYFNDTEMRRLAHRLKDDGLINTLFTHNDCAANLTSRGVDYCEGDSYTKNGHSIITNNYNVSVNGSSNTNIITHSPNASIVISNAVEIKAAIDALVEKVNELEDVTLEQKKEILECVSEIQANIDANSLPKFAFRSLLGLTADLVTLAPYALAIGKSLGL